MAATYIRPYKQTAGLGAVQTVEERFAYGHAPKTGGPVLPPLRPVHSRCRVPADEASIPRRSIIWLRGARGLASPDETGASVR